MRMRRTLTASLVILLASACTKTFTVPPGARQPTVLGALVGTEHRIMADIMKYGFPDAAMLRYREGYVLSYDGRRRLPHWVAERLNGKRLERLVSSEGMAFRVDRTIDAALRSTSADYAGSGYVRGRLAAAANHRNDRVALAQCYYLSNVAPMIGEQFRKSFWVFLERDVRRWARDSDDLFVITGPLFLPQERGGKKYVNYELLGKQEVAVPTHFWKVLLREKAGRREMAAFVVPHTALGQGTPASEFLVSVDEVESLTGLDFFDQLSEPTQAYLEKQEATRTWD